MNLTSVILVALCFLFIFGFVVFRLREIKTVIAIDNIALSIVADLTNSRAVTNLYEGREE
jgi:ABC-type branched-subunit amino acid transport system permease subunit